MSESLPAFGQGGIVTAACSRKTKQSKTSGHVKREMVQHCWREVQHHDNRKIEHIFNPIMKETRFSRTLLAEFYSGMVGTSCRKHTLAADRDREPLCHGPRAFRALPVFILILHGPSDSVGHRCSRFNGTNAVFVSPQQKIDAEEKLDRSPVAPLPLCR
jgi:hypothetical protein